ncbi:transposase [Subdoligranulum variabile DSM 15176]|uniref:Transposase n=2 Tax=Subdoligranulum variabile TaxID=214851 RepID=D1PQQ4_9FIRM|nr:transposase [Subdoligranulum variabile DSM 15176]
MMVSVGIDVSKDKHDCFIVTSDGEVLSDVFTIPNTINGFHCLLRRIQDCTSTQDKIKVGLEATGHYSYNLLGFLLDNGLTTYVLNPLRTNLYRKSLSLRKTKTDRVDARTIAFMLLSDASLNPYTDTAYHTEELKSLTRYRFDKVKERAKLKSSIARLVCILFPELEKLVPSLHIASVYALLEEFPGATLLPGHLMPADIVDLNDYQVESWPSTPEGEERQRREWREMYEILFSHSQVEAITGWDFADGAWLNAPSGLLRADNSPKPSYRELQRLIHAEWTSQGELHTDENGVAELAGFRGTYSLHTDRAQAEVQLTAQPITQPQRILLQDCHT